MYLTLFVAHKKIKRCLIKYMLGFILVLTSSIYSNTVGAQTLVEGLLVNSSTNRCIRAAKDGTGNIITALVPCSISDPAQQWRRDGSRTFSLVHLATGQCLESSADGRLVGVSPCAVSSRSGQQWDQYSKKNMIINMGSRACLMAEPVFGGTYSLTARGSSCGYDDSEKNTGWQLGAKVVQGALACKISGVMGDYADSDGRMRPSNEKDRNAALFTLARLNWNSAQFGSNYLVQSNTTRMCLSRNGPRTCDPNDKQQQYTINSNSVPDAIETWIKPYIKLNPLTPKPVVDLFDNLNKPLQITTLRNPNKDTDLFISYETRGSGSPVIALVGQFSGFSANPLLSPPRIECLAYSDRSTEYNKLSITENYILAAKYAQQEGGRALADLVKSPLTPSESASVTNNLKYADIGARTLKFYDLSAETKNDVSIKYLEAGASRLYEHAQLILGDLIPDQTDFANAVMAAAAGPLTAMEAGINSVPVRQVQGRSLLATGGSETGLMALQIRLPWALPSGLKRVPYLPSNGNFRISFPAIGHKSNAVNGELDPNSSYSDYRANKADGVFNFVATVEVDKALWEASKAWGPLLPTVDGGLEFHFAFSVRAGSRFGDRVRLDSIAINVVADVASSGGVAGMAPRIRSMMGRNRVMPAAIAETAMPNGRSLGFVQREYGFSDWLRPNLANINTPSSTGVDTGSNSLESRYFNTLEGPSVVIELSATELGQEPEIMEAITNAVNTAQFKPKALVGGLVNVLGEVGMSVKWFNRTFLREAVCRYNNPKDTSCKMGYRSMAKFQAAPDVFEPLVVMGQVSSQLNWSWDNVSIPFWPSATPTLGVILPRIQYSAATSYWLAFNNDAAIAMKAGAGQATSLAN